MKQYIRGVAVRVGSQDLSQQRSLTPKKTVSVHYIFGFFKNEFGFFIKQFKSVNSKKLIQIYCLLYTDNVQELFQRSKGIMNVKHSTKIVNEIYYSKISQPGITNSSKKLSNFNQLRSTIGYGFKYNLWNKIFYCNPEEKLCQNWISVNFIMWFPFTFLFYFCSFHSTLVAFFSNFFSILWFMFWSSSPSGLACLWLYHRANIKFLITRLRSHKTKNIMHVSLVRCAVERMYPCACENKQLHRKWRRLWDKSEIKIYKKNWTRY